MSLALTRSESLNTTIVFGTLAAVGYLAARLFTTINPVHGAIFAVINSIMFRIFTEIDPRLGAGFGFVAAQIASATIALGIMYLAGISISVTAAAILVPTIIIGCLVVVTAQHVLNHGSCREGFTRFVHG